MPEPMTTTLRACHAATVRRGLRRRYADCRRCAAVSLRSSDARRLGWNGFGRNASKRFPISLRLVARHADELGRSPATGWRACARPARGPSRRAARRRAPRRRSARSRPASSPRRPSRRRRPRSRAHAAPGRRARSARIIIDDQHTHRDRRMCKQKASSRIAVGCSVTAVGERHALVMVVRHALCALGRGGSAAARVDVRGGRHVRSGKRNSLRAAGRRSWPSSPACSPARARSDRASLRSLRHQLGGRRLFLYQFALVRARRRRTADPAAPGCLRGRGSAAPRTTISAW